MTKRMKVLIGYDGSTCARAAIDDLRTAGFGTNVEALVLSVGEAPIVPPLASHEVIEKAFVGERVMSIVNHANSLITNALEDAGDHASQGSTLLQTYFPRWHVRAEAGEGKPAPELIEKVREWSADLLVVGTQGRSAVGRFILGSVSLEVATDSPCSVRIGRHVLKNNEQEARRIIVGLDGSGSSERALKQALKREWPVGTELRVIAVDDGHSPIKLSETLSFSGSVSGIIQPVGTDDFKVFAEIRKGDPPKVLMSEASEWRADCIFIGGASFDSTPGDSANDVLTKLATNAECSIEIVR